MLLGITTKITSVWKNRADDSLEKKIEPCMFSHIIYQIYTCLQSKKELNFLVKTVTQCRQGFKNFIKWFLFWFNIILLLSIRFIIMFFSFLKFAITHPINIKMFIYSMLTNVSKCYICVILHALYGFYMPFRVISPPGDFLLNPPPPLPLFIIVTWDVGNL